MTNSTRICWICRRNEANSREHFIQNSDLKATFKSSHKPLYMHSSKKLNLKLQSTTSKFLKFSPLICEQCNTSRTQDHDRAWEKFSTFMRKHHYSVNDKVRFNRIFPYNTTQYMRYLQLHIVKKFGCIIDSENLPIAIESFSESIMHDEMHPNIYLGIANRPKFLNKKKSLGVSDITLWSKKDGDYAFSYWYIFLENITFLVMHIKDEELKSWKPTLWNPRFNRNSFRLIDFNELLEG